MANVKAGSVLSIDTSAETFSDIRAVSGFMLTAGSAAATLTIKAGSSSGNVIATVKAATDTTVPIDLPFHSGDGNYVEITGTGARAYIFGSTDS